MGIPGVYLHGLLGSKNDTKAVMEGQSARSINRKTLNKDALIETLSDHSSITYKISSHYGVMIRKRINEKAFHPCADQKILRISDSLFSLLRTSIDGKENILAITNVTNKNQHFEFDTKGTGLTTKSWRDILSGKTFASPDGKLAFNIGSFDVLWLKAT